MDTLDRSRDFGTVIGFSEDGACFVQDGKRFDASENEIGAAAEQDADKPLTKAQQKAKAAEEAKAAEKVTESSDLA